MSHSFKEAPIFFTIYTSLIVLGAMIILLPVKSLVEAMIFSQTLNGLLLPIILIFMLALINDKRLMGSYTNNRVLNGIAWFTVAILILLALTLVVLTLFPGLFA